MSSSNSWTRSAYSFTKRVRLDRFIRRFSDQTTKAALPGSHSPQRDFRIMGIPARSIDMPQHLSTLPDQRKSVNSSVFRTALTACRMAAEGPRLPRNVQAAYLRPLRRTAVHGTPSCDLQLRSYSVRNLDMMTDFAMRAAYFLGLPASGPIPLPKLVERWTVSKSNFVHKKNKENFERITLRRLIQLKDAPNESVEIWLAFLRKHAYHGVGLKANVWEHEKLGVGNEMDAQVGFMEQSLGRSWDLFGRKGVSHNADEIIGMLQDRPSRNSAA